MKSENLLVSHKHRSLAKNLPPEMRKKNHQLAEVLGQQGVERKPMLSVIIPVRADPSLPYFLGRLEDQCRGFPNIDAVEFIVVDSGSPLKEQTQCKEICDANGIRYIYHDSSGQTFSLGAARDFGVRYAKGTVVTFLDVDLRVAHDYWDRLLAFILSYGMLDNKKSFFVVPCLYLTNLGTEAFLADRSDTVFLDYFLKWIHGDTELIQNMAPCSSVIFVDRMYFLSIGGHRPEFRGHGYEDFELIHRLMGEEDILPRADNYYRDTKSWSTATYDGFRSEFSILGRAALLANLFVVHLWHPRPTSASFYDKKNVSENRERWLSFFKEFDRTQEHPEPLIDARVSNSKILVFGKQNTDSIRCLREIFPALGSPIFVQEFDYINEIGNLEEKEFKFLLQHHQIEKILFSNPYGNRARLKIYQWCREFNFPYICYERGALPDSWFFDSCGFNSDSQSYNSINWDYPISEEDRLGTIDYISECLRGENSLEKQGRRIGGDALASKLRIGRKKVLFVPLQRPSDTAIKYYSGAIGSYDNFLIIIDEIARNLKRKGWLVLCKKHPLETETGSLKYAQYVPEDTHFIDLLELSDSIALINSGVGLYAMMGGKPCYIFGDAFYAFDGLNERVSSDDIEETCHKIIEGYSIDMEKVTRFVHHLTNSIYSFAVPKTIIRKETDGSLRNVTTALDFYEIRLPGQSAIKYKRSNRGKVSLSAPLFERFRLDLVQKRLRKQHAKNHSKLEQAIVRLSPQERGLDHKTIRARKFEKLKADPYGFFNDAQIPLIRFARHFVPANRK